jgi:hypothetical protein
MLASLHRRYLRCTFLCALTSALSPSPLRLRFLLCVISEPGASLLPFLQPLYYAI